jgi:hypothetical protein
MLLLLPIPYLPLLSTYRLTKVVGTDQAKICELFKSISSEQATIAADQQPLLADEIQALTFY